MSRTPDRVQSAATPSRAYHGTHSGVGVSGVQTRPDTVDTHQPNVLISACDGAPVPEVAGALRLAERARAAGWAVRLTYALAEIPATTYVGTGRRGAIKRPAYRWATVAVRLARGPFRAFALWGQADGGRWDFDHAHVLDGQLPIKVGLRALGERIKGEDRH